MPDTRTHRGPHPEDAVLFDEKAWVELRRAVDELSWLLGRGYAGPSALKLVGDRYQLAERQRVAVARCACSDAAKEARAARRLSAEAVRGRMVIVDGYNVLTTVEVALGGGVVLEARDGTYRDVASMHGTYRKVAETVPALALLAESFVRWQCASWHWLLDSPVSNSGRLKGIILEAGASRGLSWSVELVQNPDPVLVDAQEVVATADSVVLDRCGTWFNLAREVLQGRAGVWVVSLG